MAGEHTVVKVERTIRRKILQWAEADPDEEWDVVEAKAQEKLKRRVRAWAEEDEAIELSSSPCAEIEGRDLQ